MMQKKLLMVLLASLNTIAYAACQNNITATMPDSRYQLLNNGTEVKDLKTNLIWQRCSVGQTWGGSGCTGIASQHTLQSAMQVAQNFEGGWRVPNTKELNSLVERSCYNPSINGTIFPNTISSFYVSSSPNIYGGSGLIWITSFNDGYHDYDVKHKATYYLRLVRTEQ